MAMVHGQPVTASDIVQTFSLERDLTRFVGMCNTLISGFATRSHATVPSFNERVNVKDQGIDARVDMAATDAVFEAVLDGDAVPSALLSPGVNIFQYKQRDVTAEDAKKIVTKLKQDLKKAVVKIRAEADVVPARYILFTNLDITDAKKREIKKEILKDWNGPDVVVEVKGAGDIAALLNDLPHVRSAFFAKGEFETRDEAWQQHTKSTAFRAATGLVGRSDLLAHVKRLVDDAETRAILLYGPRGVGKSRLALEATAHRAHDTVVALDTATIGPSALRLLESPGTEVLVLIDDLNADKVYSLLEVATSREGIKLLLTLPTDVDIPLALEEQPGIATVSIPPLNDIEADELLKAAGANFDWSLWGWVVQEAGGIPAILLLAARSGRDLRRGTEDFTQAIAREFEERVRRVLGAGAVEEIRLLSLMTYVGVRGEVQMELNLVCQLFGNGLSINTVLNDLDRLVALGLVQRRGDHVSVVPPMLARGVAPLALRGRTPELYRLTVALTSAGRLRLLEQLATLRGEEVQRFWDDLMSLDGPFPDLSAATGAGDLLHTAAAAAPEATVRFIYEILGVMTLEQRLDLKDDNRDHLRWALQEPLFRARTAETALRCLALLAEAENEKDISNNSTGVFTECFHPEHPQFPLPLHRRLDLLTGLAMEGASTAMLRLVVEAAKEAMSGRGAISLRGTRGAEPLDTAPIIMGWQVLDYWERLTDLLINLAQTPDHEVAAAAARVLPRCVAHCAIRGTRESPIVTFATLVDWAANGTVPVSVSDLASSMSWVVRGLTDRVPDDPEQAGVQFRRAAQVRTLMSKLDEAIFVVRLKRWAGNWSREDHMPVGDSDDQAMPVYRTDIELARLADEAVESPELIDDTTLAWLCSSEAQKAGHFFRIVGQRDVERRWLERLEIAGRVDAGAAVLASYYGGLAENDRPFVSDRLDEVLARRIVAPTAVALATSYLGGDMAGVDRFVTLLKANLISPAWVQDLSLGYWTKHLTQTQYLRLLRAIAGPRLRHAATAVKALAFWVNDGRPLDGQLAQFAWKCMESMPSLARSDGWAFDELGARLVKHDPDRGFLLLERLYRGKGGGRSWEPTDLYQENKFWKALQAVDKHRALRTLIVVAAEGKTTRFRVTWGLRGAIDQEEDGDLLLRIASECEQMAEVVCDVITAARPGFWPLALALLERHPNNHKVRDALTWGVDRSLMGWQGPRSEQTATSLAEAEELLKDAETPASAREWLTSVTDDLREQLEREQKRESIERIDGYRSPQDNPLDPIRLHLIQKTIRTQGIDALRSVVRSDDLLRALPHLDLPEEERQRVADRVEGWR